MTKLNASKILILMASGFAVVYGQDPAVRRGNRPPRVDMKTMVRPIDMHDTVWMEDMTVLEIRDSLKAGKTTALIFAGGMEDNGPYVTVSQHNSIVRAMCDSIARKLGNALCAPIVGIAAGTPGNLSPGSLFLSPNVFKGVLSDTAASLKAEGFKNVIFMVDHGSNTRPMQEEAEILNKAWEGTGTSAYYVPEYYDYHEVETFEQNVLGIHEKSEGYHDDYYTASISLAIDPNGARMPERIKANKTTINGVELNSPTAVANGKKIMAFREDAAVKAIQKLIP